MRNFSTGVRGDSVISLDVTEPLAGEAYVSALRALVIALDANLESLNPSEEAVMAEFWEWFLAAKSDDRDGQWVKQPAFVYVNLNMGFTLIVLATKRGGELSWLGNR